MPDSPAIARGTFRSLHTGMPWGNASMELDGKTPGEEVSLGTVRMSLGTPEPTTRPQRRGQAVRQIRVGVPAARTSNSPDPRSHGCTEPRGPIHGARD